MRGHQARKKYKEFLWTVGVFEKAILRWRRRGTGLRGFSVDSEPIDEEDDEDILKVFRREKVNAALDSAVKRVLSMVKSPTARQQYRRMIESFWLAKVETFPRINQPTAPLDDIITRVGQRPWEAHRHEPHPLLHFR